MIIPNFLYDERIYKYIETLVEDDETSYSNLSEIHKERIAVLIIDVLGADAFEMLAGDMSHETVSTFANFLKTADKEYAFQLLDQLRTNAIQMYAYELDTLFAEIIEIHDTVRKINFGLRPNIDHENGELTWRKSA